MDKNLVLDLVVREAELWLLKAELWLEMDNEEDAKTAIRIGMIVIEVFRREIELYNELLIQEKLIEEKRARVHILDHEIIYEEYDNEILIKKEDLYNQVLQAIR